MQEALAHGPVVLAFFKVSCPTCQYAFPFLERLHKAYGLKGVKLLGVSQNNIKDTAAFVKEFGVTFPVLLDEIGEYPVSNAYGLTNVPTIFWIAQDGEIEVSSVGWVKADSRRSTARWRTQEKWRPPWCSSQVKTSATSALVEGRRTRSRRARADQWLDVAVPSALCGLVNNRPVAGSA